MDSLVLRALMALAAFVLMPQVSAQALVRPVLAVSPDARLFAVTTPEGDLQVRDVVTGEMRALWRPSIGFLRSVAFSQSASHVDVVSEDGRQGTWNWVTSTYSRASVKASPPPRMLEMAGVSLSVAALGVQARVPGKTSLLWSSLAGEEVLVLGTDGERWAAGTASGKVVWGRFSDGAIEQSWTPGHGPVVSLVPAGSGLWLILSADFTLALWNRISSQIVGSFGL